SKDALAALHFADVEDRLSQIGVVAALGAGVKPLTDDAEEFRGRRVRIVADADPAGEQAAVQIGQQLAVIADEVQIFNLAGLNRDDDVPVKDLFDATRIDYDSFEANRDLWSVTDLDGKNERVRIITEKHEVFLSPLPLPHVSPGSLESPVYPVSNADELEEDVTELARRNACTISNTARKQLWKLVRNLVA